MPIITNKTRSYNLIFSCFLCLYMFSFIACSDKEKKQQDIKPTKDSKLIESKINNELTLIMGGDALLHTAVYNDAKYTLPQEKDSKAKPTFSYDFSKMFIHAAPLISQYDLAFYNQETILGGKELGLSSYPAFNSPQEFGDCMINLGFNLISLANNHTLDRGEKAIINSREYWSKKPVIAAGSYISENERNTAKIYEKSGITYTLLAYTYGTNGIPIPKNKEYLVNVYNKEMLKKDIENVRNKVDLLMVSMHWGNEYDFKPNKEQEEFAHYLSTLGVDIIIGHHPHVVQPIEWINNTLVIYSLGNMISAQKGLEKRVGMFAGVKIKKDSKSKKITLHDLHTHLIYTYYDKNRKNFSIYPFTKLNEKILLNYKQIYKDYLKIVTQRDIADSIRTTRL
ncbi:CapA family protein [Helicobacter bilis]|uniref:CapA family protein n=1 Tax=Helicobacter bilis TaxID=37372 RepID=UPI0026F30245|nr:CapA family protein [Helicobacter bilis]